MRAPPPSVPGQGGKLILIVDPNTPRAPTKEEPKPAKLAAGKEAGVAKEADLR